MGLIPAHAGKTRRDRARPHGDGAHPRSRGENRALSRPAPSVKGSSPLTRGKHQNSGRRRRRMGLIPAHAGKTATAGLRTRLPRAHPRSRGENVRAVDPFDFTAGSSPLTRGKRSRRVAMQKRQRLIPAHAGKTCRRCTRRRDDEAHPRSRGENELELTSRTSWKGSSPLTRGKPRSERRGYRQGGLIPAHAGKTHRVCPLMHCMRAHPRSRGENMDDRPQKPQGRGSSPLTRGKRPPGKKRRHERGLIPAHAGKTGCGALRTSERRAHPRSRGENCSMSKTNADLAGSSPLTRGKRQGRH